MSDVCLHVVILINFTRGTYTQLRGILGNSTNSLLRGVVCRASASAAVEANDSSGDGGDAGVRIDRRINLFRQYIYIYIYKVIVLYSPHPCIPKEG